MLQNGFKIGERTRETVSNEICLLCLSFLFDETCYRVNFNLKKNCKEEKKVENRVSMIDCRKVTGDQDFREYLEPLKIKKDYFINRIDNGVLSINGPP